ncbi:unnamed protein product, partial [Prunus brigantina]
MLEEVLRLLSNLENPCVSFPFPKSPINLHALSILNSQLTGLSLKKFFPAQKTNKIRQEILRFTQKEGEAFHECWERYKEMISSCPHHNIETWMQMQSFYEGLLDSERMMVDATSGEGLMNKTADEAFTLFESLSANSQQWSHNKGRGAPMKAVVSEVNPRHQEHAKAVHILRSGKQVDNKVGDANEEQEDGENVEILQPPHGQPTGSTKQPLNAPGKSTGPKDLCTNKRRFKEHEQVALSEEVSAVLQRKLPPKLKDPGSFSIPCIVGDCKFQKALLDLGASINLMPYHVYEKLNLGELQATSVSIQLADRTIRYPKGILEDVLVKVEELILPADFLVLEMEEAPIHDNQLPLILGRPFMATAGAIIDVKKGTLTMNVFDETIAFKVFEASKFPSDEHEVFQLDAIDTMVKEALPMSYLEPIEACITQSIRKEEVDSLEAVISPLLLELVCSMDSYIEVGKRYANQFESLPPPTNKVLPSIVQAPELELK